MTTRARMSRVALSLCVVAGALQVGCSSAANTDGGLPDAGSIDGGNPNPIADGGLNDGGVDAGRVDPGAADAGSFNAGIDAGAVDAGCLKQLTADGGCEPLSFMRVCDLPALMVLQNGITADDTASLKMGSAIDARCTRPAALQLVDVRNGGVLDGTGAPLIDQSKGFVAAGGTYTQTYVRWLESSGRTPIYDSTSGNVASVSRRDGSQIFSEPLPNFHAGLDYFLLELVRGRETGPLSVVAYGFYVPGTTAAAWFFEHRVMADPSLWGDSWYVVKWVDQDADAQPSAGDQFSILASGH